MNQMLDYLITKDKDQDDNEEHKYIRRMIKESIRTRDDREFTEEVRRTIESFNCKKAPGTDETIREILLQTLKKFPKLITTIYNEYLKRGCFPKMWKGVQIIPITKPGKENSMDPQNIAP